MALSTVASVRRRGGLNHVEDFNLYRVADEAELAALVQEDIDLAEAFLQDRVAATYYTGTPLATTRYNVIFKRAEELFALAFLTMPLKIRKVEGTHWAVDQEEASSFAELIDNEYYRQAEVLIEPYLIIDTGTDAPFALPIFLVTEPLDRSTVTVIDAQLDELLGEANGAIGVQP